MYSNKSAIQGQILESLANVLNYGLGDGEATVAIDTEYVGTHTLTVQAASRLDNDTLAVQVYKSEAVPDLPVTFNQNQYLPVEKYSRFWKQVVVRRIKPLTADLSPMIMVRDLFAIDGLDLLTRAEGDDLVEQLGVQEQPPVAPLPGNVRWCNHRHRLVVPSIRLTMVGHFLTTDLFRSFGQDYLAGLLTHDGNVVPQCRKLIKFVDTQRPFEEPVVGYFQTREGFHECRLRTLDTILPYGHASLETHSQSFLGLGKCDAITEEEKADMPRVFVERTADAYGYAMADAVNTLLVHEQMQLRDRQIYRDFGFPDADIPPLKPTLGSRVSTFLVQATRRLTHGSEILKSQASLEELMARGATRLFEEEPDASRFGVQTGKVHGGLLYSRSPTRLWHEAPGQLRDVDMSGCYQKVIERIAVRWGRPVVFEPGQETLRLQDAVNLAMREADPDAWMVRVTGDIHSHPNALLPSTDGAMTAANFRRRREKRRRAKLRAFQREDHRDRGAAQGTRGSRLYTARVESGVVTMATWLMIQALPDHLRHEYEHLAVESLVFFPRSLTAQDAQEYDTLVQRHGLDGLPWKSTLDMEGLELVHREKIDSEYVTLHFPIGHYARRIGELRREAQEREGKRSGMDLAWKQHANTMYGVLCSKYLPTNNVVAANVVTAQARAEAFAIGQALNCIQTITDGCTYRRDQIPAVPFAECLRIRPDYTVRRAEDGEGIPFQDPATIPDDDAAFTDWLRAHLKWFFGVQGTEYDTLFGTHSFEHKKTRETKSTSFDAMCCDGAGNYLKCTADGDGWWRVEDFAARSFGKGSKGVLQDWLVRTYQTDTLEVLSPLAEDSELLSFERAKQKARKALTRGLPAVLFPLRLEHRKVANYRILKPSAFVFQTPAQRAAWVKAIQKFEKRTGAGLEVLALRRSYGGRRRGSLSALAEELHRLVMAGEMNPAKALNLTRRAAASQEVCGPRLDEIKTRKRDAERQLVMAMDTRRLDPVTGYVVDPEALGVQVRRGRPALAESSWGV
jgi:hypothetical protein